MFQLTAIACALLSASLIAQGKSVAVRDLGGKTVRPLEATGERGQRGVLLIFLSHDCPIANTYAPEISRICAKYESKKVACYVVYVEADLTAEAARKHAAEFKLRCKAPLDP